MEHKTRVIDTDQTVVAKDVTIGGEGRFAVLCESHRAVTKFGGRAAARAASTDSLVCDKPTYLPIAEKTAKAPRASKSSRFPGTYTVEQAADLVRVAKAGGEEFGKSKLWTVRIAGEFVAPKWIMNKLTGISVSEFTTADAVSFLARIGLKAYKSS